MPGSDESVELFKPFLEVDDVACEIDGGVDDETDPHLGH